MAAKNDITGDSIQTRGSSDAYRNNFDLIFRKKEKKVEDDNEVSVQVQTERDDIRDGK